jgi:hypothetical protein
LNERVRGERRSQLEQVLVEIEKLLRTERRGKS